MKTGLTILFIFCTHFCYASETGTNSGSNSGNESASESSGQKALDTLQKVNSVLNTSKSLRERSSYFLFGNYSPVDLLIPSKYGFSFGITKNVDQSWEFEYLRGSISVPVFIEDLGKMTDERYSIIGRSFFGGNSFNLSYGITYFDFSIHVGDRFISHLAGSNLPNADLVGIQAYGFNVGIGNRWSFNHNISIGVDWLSWLQPVTVTNKNSGYLESATNQQDRDDVNKAINIISYLPRIAIAKIQFGMLF